MRSSMDAARDVVREGFAWPGGYELSLVTTDGGILCRDCVKAEYRLIYDAARDDRDDGWNPFGVQIWLDYGDDDSRAFCDHCGRPFCDD